MVESIADYVIIEKKSIGNALSGIAAMCWGSFPMATCLTASR